jgi:hypothetical protein
MMGCCRRADRLLTSQGLCCIDLTYLYNMTHTSHDINVIYMLHWLHKYQITCVVLSDTQGTLKVK